MCVGVLFDLGYTSLTLFISSLFWLKELPQELIERLSHSEINSISDLQRLLDIDFVGKSSFLTWSAVVNFVQL